MKSNSQNSTFVDMINVVATRELVDPDLAKHLAAVEALLRAEKDNDRPFLTVLLRTQGRRLEPLKDALLCLAAQTQQDFEVIVLEHDAAPDDAERVKEVVARLEPGFAQRVSLVEVEGGLRAKPLNVGIQAANGQYVAVFDDDDLLFANWVEEFHHASIGAEGRMLRAVVANQSVSPEVWPQDHDGFRTSSWPKAEFPTTFNQLNHLVVNHSPFMSWAFPRSLFFTFGLRFDEELTVCEDWDMILRGSLLCGVTEVPALTSIYRRWQDGGASSYSAHSLESWKASEQRVIDRINNGPIMLPAGAMYQLRDLLIFTEALNGYRFLFKGHRLRQPLGLAWEMMSPAVSLAVRARNRVRRLRAR